MEQESLYVYRLSQPPEGDTGARGHDMVLTKIREFTAEIIPSVRQPELIHGKLLTTVENKRERRVIPEDLQQLLSDDVEVGFRSWKYTVSDLNEESAEFTLLLKNKKGV